MKSNRKELYADKSFRNSKGNDADLKNYRMGKKNMNMKEYRTPEYLTRQKDYRTKDSNIYKDARESDVDRFTSTDTTREARIRDSKPGFLDWLNPFSKKNDFQGSDKAFRTSDNRSGSRAIQNAPVPEPMSEIGAGPQDQRDSSLSMDDVKKMINPEDYRSQ